MELKLKNTAKMYLMVALALGLVQCTFLFFYYHNHRSFSEGFFPPGPPDLPMTVEAPRLLNFYDLHHAAADDLFFDKDMEVRGTVVAVTNGTVLTLATGNPASSIQCTLEGAFKDVPAPGSYVAVKGRCLGYDRDVVLVHCLVKPADSPLR